MMTSALLRILYIEDTAAARDLVVRILAGHYRVLEAADPLTGIELAQQTHPALVLLDINLPGMSGLEVATRLRSLLPGTPMVALTADTSPAARERAIAAGCDGFLTKPVDVEALPGQLAEYIAGKRETIPDLELHRQAYVGQLVERLEQKVRELTRKDEQNEYLQEQNTRMIMLLRRRQRLLEAGARTAHSATAILDMDGLLRATVDTICKEFGFYYAGIFLLDGSGENAVLRAGHGEAGVAMLAAGHKLAVNGNSMIGAAVREQAARIALNVGEVTVHFKNPHLPRTRSEMALPLLVNQQVLGALTVQSEQLNAFNDEDKTALQLMADQVAVAISNAQLLQDLDRAHQELVRNKTFEAIATATGEAIHWVGNRAAPIPGSAARVREDVTRLLALVSAVVTMPEAERAGHPFVAALRAEIASAEAAGIDLYGQAAALAKLSSAQLLAQGYVESVLEDLDIIRKSAVTILDIKEDLIGPARLMQLSAVALGDVIRDAAQVMAYPSGVLQLALADDLPPVQVDARQLNRVYINLFKNAWEAMDGAQPAPQIVVSAKLADEEGFVLSQVRDNGPGIPAHVLDKIWVSFFTTKGQRGGTGLGLSACLQSVSQMGGRLWAESEPGNGATFNLLLPIAAVKPDDETR